MSASSSICVVAVLNGEQKFIDEWLVYHRMIGVDHFFLYDDDPSQSLQYYLKPYANYTTVIKWRNEGGTRKGNQISAYYAALNDYASRYEWVAFLDGDEYIVLRQHLTLKEFLDNFADEAAISLNWHMFGNNGFYYDPTRLMTSSLTRRMAVPFGDVKTITKTAAIAEITTPHYCLLKYGERVDANGRKYMDKVYEGKTDVAHINHYHCRSFKHWMSRVDRGHINYNPLQSPNQQKWRFDKELCLERFVTKIGRDKNEYVDEFMLRYKYDIHENKRKIRNTTTPVIHDFLTPEQKINAKKMLQLIVGYLKANAQLDNIGLFSGKSGIATFLFHYSRFANDSECYQFAFSLLDNIVDEINENPPVNISNGLAGYGIALEHALAESFIKIDTDELLEDVDVLMQYTLWDIPGSQNDTMLDLAMYFVYRFNNPVNEPYSHQAGKNKSAIEYIIQTFNSKDQSYTEKLDFLNLTCISYLHRDNRSEIANQLKELTLNVVEEPSANKSPLRVAKVLVKLYKETEDAFYYNLAIDVLNKYENEPWQHVYKSDFNGCIYIGLHYLYLGKVLNKESYIEKGIDCLALNIIANHDWSSNSDFKKTIGYGLILISIIGEWSEELFDIAIAFSAELNNAHK